MERSRGCVFPDGAHFSNFARRDHARLPGAPPVFAMSRPAKRGTTTGALRRYLLLQIPGWLAAGLVVFALCEWAGLSPRLAAAFFVLWFLKDLLFYPLVRRAYEGGARTGAEKLIGESGVVRRDLDPRGYVQLRGELWRAEARDGEEPIRTGTTVRVVGAHRLTVTVVREDGDEDRS